MAGRSVGEKKKNSKEPRMLRSALSGQISRPPMTPTSVVWLMLNLVILIAVEEYRLCKPPLRVGLI